MVYLASPYQPQTDAEKERYEEHLVKQYEIIVLLTSRLQIKYRGTHVIYAPIVHSHPISLHMPPEIKKDQSLWLDDIDLPIIKQCMDEIWIAKIDGWNKSSGIKREKKLSERLGLGIYYVCPETLELTEEE
jgi:hypothetical protein